MNLLAAFEFALRLELRLRSTCDGASSLVSQVRGSVLPRHYVTKALRDLESDRLEPVMAW
jgi:hypothetical protein